MARTGIGGGGGGGGGAGAAVAGGAAPVGSVGVTLVIVTAAATIRNDQCSVSTTSGQCHRSMPYALRPSHRGSRCDSPVVSQPGRRAMAIIAAVAAWVSRKPAG